jgi:hypothetical protein
MRSSTRKDAGAWHKSAMKEVASRPSYRQKRKHLILSSATDCVSYEPAASHCYRKAIILSRKFGNLSETTMAERLLVTGQALRTNCVLPRPERVLFRFPDRLPNLFQESFWCCKLHAFLYIGGYTILTQSNLKPSKSVAFAVCCPCFSLHYAVPAGTP